MWAGLSTEDLRQAVVQYAAQQQADGGSMRTVARDLGVSAENIKRWSERLAPSAPCGARVQRVEIVGDITSTTCGGPDLHMVVHSPNGLRIEGLTMDALVQLVRALG